jgi:zinc transport system ATP-binding protein
LKEGENMKVKVENLNFKYPGHQALKDVSFVIENGEFLTVLGQNGAGKSTLIDCLINDNPTEAGKIFYNDVELHKFHNWQKIGIVPQTMDIISSGFPVSVKEFLLAYENKHNIKRVDEVVSLLNINYLMSKNLSDLSGGETKRVFIARAVLNKPELIYMDEPFNSVDVKNTLEIVNILDSLKKQGITIILVTHNFDLVKEVSDKVIELNTEVLFFGKSSEFIQRGTN